MIDIEVFYNNDNRVVGFAARGHAMSSNRADKYDLVCCAVSVLTITTINGITDYLKVNPQELSVDDGWLKMILPLNEDGGIAIADEYILGQVDALLGSMVQGLEQVAEDYPQFAQLRKRRWTS